MRSRWRLVAGVVLAAVAAGGAAFAEGRVPLEELLFDKGILTKEEAASVQKRKFSSALDRITFSGDVRLRHESFYRNTADDRHRQRFRLRLGADMKLDTITVGIRLASGTGEQVSTNKSFDNLSSQTALYIDRAFVRWQGENTRWLTLTGGRMANPFWTVYSTDAVWDDDYNPEGVAEQFAWKLGGADLFLNMAQIVLDEDSSGKPSTDQWLYGQQLGIKTSPIKDVKTGLAVAYYNAVNVQNNNLGQGVCQDGNSRVSACASPLAATGVLVNDYNVVDVTAEVATKVASLPVAVMGDYVTNTADTVNALGSDTKDSGYQAGLIVGKASDPQTWETAYFFKRVGNDATLADVADSDFGNGGTGRKGHIMWAAYNPTKSMQVKVKYFLTEIEDDAASPNDVNRLQADLSVKF
ncbi:MAG: putative porin [Nitrospirota bacterium]